MAKTRTSDGGGGSSGSGSGSGSGRDAGSGSGGGIKSGGSGAHWSHDPRAGSRDGSGGVARSQAATAAAIASTRRRSVSQGMFSCSKLEAAWVVILVASVAYGVQWFIATYYADDEELMADRRETDMQGAKLWVAAAMGNVTMVNEVMQNVSHAPNLEWRHPEHETTPIMEAVKFDRRHTVEALVAGGADARAVDKEGSPVLHIAAANAARNSLVWLLENSKARLDVSTLDRLGCTPVHHAVYQRGLEAAKALVAAGADPRQKDARGSRPVHWAALGGADECIEWLLDDATARGASSDVNARNHMRHTPLHLAVGGRRLDTAKLLVQHGADVRAKDKKQATVMHAAAASGSPELLEWLFTTPAGKDAQATTKFGVTPLAMAEEEGQEATAKALREFLSMGRSLVDRAAELDLAGVERLLALHAPVDYAEEGAGRDGGQGERGRTALYAAVAAAAEDDEQEDAAVPVVRALLDAGAGTRIPDAHGKTAEQLARDATDYIQELVAGVM